MRRVNAVPYEMRMRLEQIEHMKVLENRGKVLAAGIGSAGFCYLFQGSLRDTAAAFVAGVLRICSFYTQLRAFLRPG
ncbi:MAG: threonine/serine exporter family protein [Clostridium fessum]